ncbi:hypothetical protein QBC40DRAFT_254580 [Triangularia verruculosa]|uniref:Uncharacterized protein n=1 Tax=Triangularia verruculosa TaxID=2587418 RepID=A0AAN6XLL6_9PEZI|nr:hypothetical protein QBC40DRAFT_254580 [Triangularia verruculosa]
MDGYQESNATGFSRAQVGQAPPGAHFDGHPTFQRPTFRGVLLYQANANDDDDDDDDDDEPEESFIEDDRWIKPDGMQAKIQEVIEKKDPALALNPNCGCGDWFFTRAFCRHPYPKCQYYCPAAKDRGDGKFCRPDSTLPKTNVNEIDSWYIISDETCQDCLTQGMENNRNQMRMVMPRNILLSIRHLEQEVESLARGQRAPDHRIPNPTAEVLQQPLHQAVTPSGQMWKFPITILVSTIVSVLVVMFIPESFNLSPRV